MVKGINKKKLKTKVYTILADKNFKDKLYTISDIKKKLGNYGFSQDDLLDVLDELMVEGKIMKDKELYRVFAPHLGFVQGKIFMDEKGNGHVEVPVQEEDETKKVVYTVLADDLNDALVGDIVLLKPVQGTSKGHPLARVEQIVKRNVNLVFCIAKIVDDEVRLEPENLGFKHSIVIP